MSADSGQPGGMQQLEALIAELEQHGDPGTVEQARAVVHGVLDLHREGVQRIIEVLRESDSAEDALRAMAHDAAISSVLALHDLHPSPLRERVQEALAETDWRLRGEDASAEIERVEGEAVRLRIAGSRPGSGPGLRQAIERAVLSRAPEVQLEVIVDVPSSGNGFVSVDRLAGDTEGQGG